jgi:hypothetical protein
MKQEVQKKYKKKPKVHVATRFVLFEKRGSSADLDFLFHDLINYCSIKKDILFPDSLLFVCENKVVFEQNLKQRIFKINLDIFWQKAKTHFGNYEETEYFSLRMIKKYLGLLEYEVRPLRSIFINQLDTQMWENARNKMVKESKKQKLSN